MDRLDQAIEIAEKTESLMFQGIILSRVFIFLSENGKYEKAEEVLKKAVLTIENSKRNDFFKGRAFEKLVCALLEVKSTDDAIEISKKIKDPFDRLMITFEISEELLLQGKKNTGDLLLKEVLEILDKVNNDVIPFYSSSDISDWLGDKEPEFNNNSSMYFIFSENSPEKLYQLFFDKEESYILSREEYYEQRRKLLSKN